MKKLEDFRGDDPAVRYDERHDVPIARYSSIASADISVSEPSRYLIEDPRYTLPIDVLLYPKPGRRLLVGFHGAEDRRKFDPPKFQFVRSFSTLNEPMLFVSDTTVLQSDKINIGWCAGNRATPLPELLAEMIVKIGKALGVEETVLVGHSAGGFSAILVGSHVPNSRAVSVNGQSVVTRYYPWTVRNLREAAFPECSTIEEMENAHRSRLDLREALKNRLPGTSFTYFGNTGDKATFGKLPHFPLLAESFGLSDAGGRTVNGDAFVPCEWSPMGVDGHALPGTILPFIKMTLGLPHKLDITHGVDPRWRP